MSLDPTSTPPLSAPAHGLAPHGAAADRMIDTDDHHLAVYITGTNTPTVVLVAGFGGRHLPWWQVRDLLGDVQCASFGRSRPDRHDPPPLPDDPEPRTAEWGADQLHRLLRAANLTPPYVLVGYTVGAWITDRFATAWPDQVAGLVQLDPTPLTPIPDVEDDLGDSAEARATADADGDGVTFSWAASRAELDACTPPSPRRAVVISRATRTPRFTTDERTWPALSGSTVDLDWLASQAEWAQRLHADHVLATRGDYYLFKSAPELVALVIRHVITAARRHTDLTLDAAHLALVDGIRLSR